MSQRVFLVLILAVNLGGCSLALPGLTWADQNRERRAATVGPDELATFEDGQRIELRLIDGTEYEAEFAGLETVESGRVVILRREGAAERVAPESIVWIRPRQKSYVIHAFVFGVVVDTLAIVLGRHSPGI